MFIHSHNVYVCVFVCVTLYYYRYLFTGFIFSKLGLYIQYQFT